MKTLIYTPLYKNSQAVPHIVEHCIGKKYPFTYEWFFRDKLPFTKEITGELTSVVSDIGISVETIINMLKQGIDTEVYNYEKKILKEECKNMHQGGLIYESMIRKITDKNIEISGWKICNYREVEKYYKKYYTQDNIIVYDDNVGIYDEFSLEFLGNDILNYFQSLVGKSRNIFHKFVFDDVKFYMFGYEGLDFVNYWNLVFTRIIFDSFCTYFMRYKEGIYFYESATFDSFDKYIWVTVPQFDYTSLNENFFDEAKLYIKSILETGSLKEKIFLSGVVFGIKNVRSQVINLCNNFSRSQFSSVFQKF